MSSAKLNIPVKHNSPENPTWVSSNKDGIQSSAPSSGTSSPAMHLDSAITAGTSSTHNPALALTGVAVELHEPGNLQSTSSNQLSLDIDTDAIDDATDACDDDEIDKALLTTQASKDLETDSRDVSLALSYGDEDNTESLTVIADVQAGIRSNKQPPAQFIPMNTSIMPEDNMPSMDTIGEESDMMVPVTVAAFVDQEIPVKEKDAEKDTSIEEGKQQPEDVQQLDTQSKSVHESGGCNQSVPVNNEAIEQVQEQQLEAGIIRNDKEETIDDEDLGIIDEDKEIAEQLMTAPIDALELSQ